MKGVFTAYKINEKYLPFITLSVILAVTALSFLKFSLTSLPVGDEEYYRNEVAYLADFGWYNSLCQGTSFVYSLLVYLCAKITFSDYLVGGRVLSVIAYLISCRLLFLFTGRVKEFSLVARHMCILAFSVYCYGWLWKSLADIVCIPFVFGALYLIATKYNYKILATAAVLLFIGFAIKPTTMFMVPGFALAIFMMERKIQTVSSGVVKSVFFGGVFVFCFVVYHVPGFLTYGKLMLEDKSHSYVGKQRVANGNRWNELIVYFEQYNVNHKPNRWQITWGELDTFIAQHPEVNLKVGYVGYVKQYTASYFKNIWSKLFLTLPYSIQGGFFIAKWTIMNKLVHSIVIIKLLTLLLIAGIFYVERDFVRKNGLWLLVPFSYYLLLSIYIFAQLEENWLVVCMPLMALPVIKFFTDRVNILLLAALQIVYLII